MRLKEPFLIINFKTYESGTGKNAEELAEICSAVSKATHTNIIVAPQTADILRTGDKITTFAQHIDNFEPGKNTGFLTAEAAEAAGASGTILNHAEHKIPIPTLAAAIERAKKNKMITVVCAASISEAQEIAKACTPDYIAVEPPELIGGNISVSKANPDIITGTIKAVQSIKKIPVICGAGVSGQEDVKVAVKLGAKGVLVANFVMGAKDKKKAVQELAEGLI